MPSYGGTALSISWVYSGGTVSLNTDYRTVSYAPSVDLVEETAGSDVNKLYIAFQKDGKVSYSGLMQAGGTAITNGLAEGTPGTLIIGPEGTATGKQKISMPAISLGANYQWPFNGMVEISCEFQQNGQRTDGVY